MKTIVYILISMIGFQSFFIQKKDKRKIMHIKLDKTSYFMGEAMPMTVTFENPSKDTVVLENPSKSSNVVIHLVDSSDHHDYFYTMGKIEISMIDRKTDRYVALGAPKEVISIAPSSSFGFITNVNERLYLEPGNYNCYVTESNNQSNQVEIKISFNELSVICFFKMVQNKNMGYGVRDWAMKGIQRIYPRFKLNLSTENDPEDNKAKKEAGNIPVYQEFAEWWKKNKDTKEIKNLFNQ